MKNGLLESQISLMEFTRMFSADWECSEFIKYARWPNGVVVCPFCKHEKVYELKGSANLELRLLYKCAKKDCRKKFSINVGTIFEGSKIPLSTWLYLIYSMAINTKSISSRQTARNLGVTQKTTWGMLHKIRLIFKDEYFVQLSGIIEIDECFMGGGTKWKRFGSKNGRKAPILGMIERGGRVIIREICDRRESTVEAVIRKYVKEGSIVYTDGWMSYRNLPTWYRHNWIDHSGHDYVRGEVHTNTIENVWSLMKKGIRNGSHYISAKHCQRYCDEVAYRFNTRHMKGFERFNNMLIRAVAKPYNDITEEGKIINVSEYETENSIAI